MGIQASKASRFISGRALVAAIVLTLPATACFAYTGTSDQRSQCTGDVFRLCSSEIPNIDRIVACLRKEKPNLSPGCRSVMNSADQEKTATRSLAPPENQWCAFEGHLVDPSLADWVKWCGAAK